MTVSVQSATPETFDEIIAGSGSDLIVTYFWGPDCPNCEVFAADFHQLLSEIPQSGVRIVKVNAYDHPDLARRFGLFGIPGFVLFRCRKKLGMMRQYYGRDYWTQVIREQAAQPNVPSSNQNAD